MQRFEAMERRAIAAARRKAEALVGRLIAVVRDAGFTVEREGERIIVSGRGLARQWIEDARLRFALWRQP